MATTFGLAFLAGILSVLSPCALPLLPLVLGAAESEHRLGPAALAAGLALSFVAIGLFVATGGFALLGFALTPLLDGLTGLDVARLTNGSVDYLPALLALFGVAWAAARRPEERFVGTGRRLAGIGLLFLISLAARTADRAAFALLPTGTHPLWHVLNAVVLYALVATAIRHRETAG